MTTTLAEPEVLPRGLLTLTPRQRQIVDTYVALLCDHCVPPSIREMMEATGIASPNGIVCHVEFLIKKGWLQPREVAGQSRSWLLTDAALAHLQRVSADPGAVRVRLLAPEVEMSPAEARNLAARLCSAADRAEGL